MDIFISIRQEEKELNIGEKGVLKMGRLGKATIRLLKAQDLIKTAVPILEKDPKFSLTEKEWRWDS